MKDQEKRSSLTAIKLKWKIAVTVCQWNICTNKSWMVTLQIFFSFCIEEFIEFIVNAWKYIYRWVQKTNLSIRELSLSWLFIHIKNSKVLRFWFSFFPLTIQHDLFCSKIHIFFIVCGKMRIENQATNRKCGNIFVEEK